MCIPGRLQEPAYVYITFTREHYALTYNHASKDRRCSRCGFRSPASGITGGGDGVCADRGKTTPAGEITGGGDGECRPPKSLIAGAITGSVIAGGITGGVNADLQR